MEDIGTFSVDLLDVGVDRCFDRSVELMNDSIVVGTFGDTKSGLSSNSGAYSPNPIEYACLRGNIHCGRGEFTAAIDKYTEGLDDLTPHLKSAAKNNFINDVAALLYANRSAAYFALGLPRYIALALEDAQSCLHLRPNWPRGYYRRGVAERALSMYRRARASFDSGHQLAVKFGKAEGLTMGVGSVNMASEFVAAMEELEKTIAYEGLPDDVMTGTAPGSNATDTSATKAETDEPETDKFTELEAWLLSRNSSSFPFLYMKKYSENNRGVHARIEIPAECPVLTVGREFLITVEMGRACPIGRKLAAANIDRDLSASKHCYLALFVLEDRKNPDSFFQPYYRILPEAYPNMPIFWSDEELAYLKGSYILQQIADRKENLTLDYDYIRRAVPEVEEICTLEEFWWARMMVASRNFGILVDNLRTDALVPYADMLNHWRPRQTRWAFDNRKQAFVIHSLMRLHAGQQVYDSYGKKCNSRFLLNYGFAVDYNKDDETGQNHNEVRLLLEMFPPEQDAWRQHKLRLLGDTSSADDTLVSYGHPALRTMQRGRTVETSRSVRISTFYENEGTVEAFSFARFIVAKDTDIAYLPRTESDHDFQRRPIAAISIENELAALKLLASHCQDQLSKYTTTLEEDIEELRSGRWPYGSNKRNSLVLLKGEKEVCHYYIQLYDLCTSLAVMPWPDFNTAVTTSFFGSSDEHKYIRLVFAKLMRKRRDEQLVEAPLRMSALSISDVAQRYGLP